MIAGKADPSDRSDDIAQLRQYLAMPALSYQDISMMVGVQQALQRWPLLGESCMASLGNAAVEQPEKHEALRP
ncbi:cellulose biosynthesis protein BcsR [Pseudomonas sp. NPDC089396]|uniref:cellulose biosynthesis protein BcsR n=1 Tax=Pseudomonas sp. NPDC089396 TaxID=3364461 RepID=UPI00383317C2